MSGIDLRMKPTLKCLCLHQVAWDVYGSVKQFGHEGVINVCLYCKDYFYYPTRRLAKPIYRKFRCD